MDMIGSLPVKFRTVTSLTVTIEAFAVDSAIEDIHHLSNGFLSHFLIKNIYE